MQRFRRLRTALEVLLHGDGPSFIGDERRSPATKAALQMLWLQWEARAANGPIHLANAGLRVFSQMEEDGLLLAIFAAIGTTNRLFVDIGAADGINSNCANLAVNFGWHGLFIDGSSRQTAEGRSWYASHPDTFLHPPISVHAIVTRENINELVQSNGFTGEIDFLSIDIDGNDYWIWEALDIVTPRVVIAESNRKFAGRAVTIPYDPAFVHVDDYAGASAEALCHLASTKGYRLVGANRYGFNLIFVRRGIGETVLPCVSLDSVRQHPHLREATPLAELLRGRPLVTIEPRGVSPDR